jgi:hypothetical protein
LYPDIIYNCPTAHLALAAAVQELRLRSSERGVRLWVGIRCGVVNACVNLLGGRLTAYSMGAGSRYVKCKYGAGPAVLLCGTRAGVGRAVGDGAGYGKFPTLWGVYTAFNTYYSTRMKRAGSLEAAGAPTQLEAGVVCTWKSVGPNTMARLLAPILLTCP